MVPWLAKELGDTLCTIIALGYMKEDGSRTKFQYEKDEPGKTENKDKADAVQKLIKAKANLNITISEAIPQGTMPLIVAKTDKVSNLQEAIERANVPWKYLQSIEVRANRTEKPIRGAYIGGMSTIGKTFIVGPSDLALYTPKYRAPDDVKIKDWYNDAVKATNTALACLEPIPVSPKVPITLVNKINKITEPFQDGKLFKSIHGMIQAMVEYQTDYEKNNFIFEIALGKGTTKVSSCVPCSIFMTVNSYSPTSTHLGAGDNWNIPSKCNDILKSNWKKKINEYYTAGKALISSNQKVQMLATKIEPDHIPEIFLEALTFQSKFSEKITATLQN